MLHYKIYSGFRAEIGKVTGKEKDLRPIGIGSTHSSFNKLFLSTLYVPNTVLGIRYCINKTSKVFALKELMFEWKEKAI